MQNGRASTVGVLFSPDGKLIASASFDKSIRILDGLTGKFIVRLLGHGHSVYQMQWSADPRKICILLYTK